MGKQFRLDNTIDVYLFDFDLCLYGFEYGSHEKFRIEME